MLFAERREYRLNIAIKIQLHNSFDKIGAAAQRSVDLQLATHFNCVFYDVLYAYTYIYPYMYICMYVRGD